MAFDGVFLLFGNVRLLLFPGVFDPLADIDPFSDLLKDLLSDWPNTDWFRNELDVLPLEISITVLISVLIMLKVTYCSLAGRCWDLLRRLMGSSMERVSNVPNISFKPAGTLAEFSPPNMFLNLKMSLR